MDWRDQAIADMIPEPPLDAPGAEARLVPVTANLEARLAAAALLEADTEDAMLELRELNGSPMAYLDQRALLRAALKEEPPLPHLLTIGQKLEFFAGRPRSGARETYGRIQYAYSPGETHLHLNVWTESYGDDENASWSGWQEREPQMLLEVPALTPVRSWQQLQQQLRERLAIHPVLGLLPSTAIVLIASRDYMVVEATAKMAARFLSPMGLARALSVWLTEPDQWEDEASFLRLRHHARLGLLMLIGLQELLGLSLPPEMDYTLFGGMDNPQTPSDFGQKTHNLHSYEQSWNTYLIDLFMIMATGLSTVPTLWDHPFGLLGQGAPAVEPPGLDEPIHEDSLGKMLPTLLGQPLQSFAPWLAALLDGDLPRKPSDNSRQLDDLRFDGPEAWALGFMIIGTARQ